MSSTTRRGFLLASGASFAVLASGCNTIAASDEVDFYQETIENVMIAPKDGRILVAGATKYFYMFEKNTTLEGVLGASFRQSMQASFDTFTLTGGRDIVGSYTIRTNAKLTPEQVTEAKRIGFRSDAAGNMVLNASIKGVRFVPDQSQRNLPRSTNRPYPVQVKSITPHKSDHSHYPSSVSEGAFVVTMFVLFAVFGN